MHRLRPCPFCGAYGEKIITVKESYLYELQACKVMYVQCIKCGARSGYAASEQEAQKNWNNRKTK